LLIPLATAGDSWPSIACPPQELIERLLMPRLRWRERQADEMGLPRRRLLPSDFNLPFELTARERDLNPSARADRQPLVGGEKRAAAADVDDADPNPPSKPEFVAALCLDPRRSPPFLKLARHAKPPPKRCRQPVPCTGRSRPRCPA